MLGTRYVSKKRNSVGAVTSSFGKRGKKKKVDEREGTFRGTSLSLMTVSGGTVNLDYALHPRKRGGGKRRTKLNERGWLEADWRRCKRGEVFGEKKKKKHKSNHVLYNETKQKIGGRLARLHLRIHLCGKGACLRNEGRGSTA